MPINADKPHLWKADTRASVDQFNRWFMKFTPQAYRDTRSKTVESVEQGLNLTDDFSSLKPEVLKKNPGILPMLRMSTCPPLARDRLIGLADATKNLVGCLELGKLPPQMEEVDLDAQMKKITGVLARMLDKDIFPWLEEKRQTYVRRALSFLYDRCRSTMRCCGGAHRQECSGETAARHY